jgi:hypothetical protein
MVTIDPMEILGTVPLCRLKRVSPTRLENAASIERPLFTGLKMSQRSSVTAAMPETAMRPPAIFNGPRTKSSVNAAISTLSN